MKQKFIKKQKGITLVALVVTIVVLLILAGITIMYTMGDNNIFKKAQEAKNKTEEAIKNEQEYMNSIDNMVNEYINKTVNGEISMPTDEPIENIKSDWSTIEKIAKEIAKDDTITSETEEVKVILDGKRYIIKPGDIFEVEYEGEVKRVRVLGFKHDDLVNTGAYGGNHSKASISFEFLDFVTGSTYKSMNGSNTNSGGWAATQMRKDLNGYSNENAAQNGAIGGLGANLNNKSYIKQAKKKYIGTYNDANSVTRCNDYLWLLASSEIISSGYQNGTYGVTITSEGSQYKYYQSETDAWDASSIGRQKRPSSSDSTDWWWLRSPGYNYSKGFCSVGIGGSVGHYDDAIRTYGVAPGFCI
ncbi:MAG: type II secretion system protein [Clostridia bacterium]|nr:type II secretion system protein [Clostridia bacterium]